MEPVGNRLKAFEVFLEETETTDEESEQITRGHIA